MIQYKYFPYINYSLKDHGMDAYTCIHMHTQGHELVGVYMYI